MFQFGFENHIFLNPENQLPWKRLRPFNNIIIFLPDPDHTEVVVEDVYPVHQDLIRVHRPALVQIESSSTDYS